jgi:hypothetical protein
VSVGCNEQLQKGIHCEDCLLLLHWLLLLLLLLVVVVNLLLLYISP